MARHMETSNRVVEYVVCEGDQHVWISVTYLHNDEYVDGELHHRQIAAVFVEGDVPLHVKRAVTTFAERGETESMIATLRAYLCKSSQKQLALVLEATSLER